jgi:hypothetical protein
MVEEKRGIHQTHVAAVGTGEIVYLAFADTIGQIGALSGVHDEPDFQGEGLIAVGTRDLSGS